ncbi:hypothetical protein [Candidatus Hamiltonella defensa]|uniref:hypothetical protein n=1 Tax=Candidatus Williamhamiltonella defendens TaxID=138072 RepID=UPI002670AC99|nr:hypothetical protein [Candidatus Hamiltonella defensa]
MCVNICSELACRKKDVVLVDSDRQGTSSNWLSDRNSISMSIPIEFWPTLPK